MNTFVIVLHGFVSLVDKVPADKNVKAGWGAFALFIGLIAAVALLCWSMYRHLRKTDQNAAAGVFGDEDKTSSRANSGFDTQA
ncbi:MAG: hypothetical protein JWP74_3018 [Marmoricola sp.]|nr:hypothetical protein [Marmoricola sp.]